MSVATRLWPNGKEERAIAAHLRTEGHCELCVSAAIQRHRLSKAKPLLDNLKALKKEGTE